MSKFTLYIIATLLIALLLTTSCGMKAREHESKVLELVNQSTFNSSDINLKNINVFELDFRAISEEDALSDVYFVVGEKGDYRDNCLIGQYTKPTITESSLLRQRTRASIDGDGICICGLSTKQPIYLSLVSSEDETLVATKIDPYHRRNKDCHATRIPTIGILPWEPLGTYILKISQGRHYLYYNFDVVASDRPLFYYSPRIDAHIAIGFEPFEEIQVFERNGNFISQATKLSLDDKGEGVLVNNSSKGDRVSIDGILRQYQNNFSVIRKENVPIISILTPSPLEFAIQSTLIPSIPKNLIQSMPNSSYTIPKEISTFELDFRAISEEDALSELYFGAGGGGGSHLGDSRDGCLNLIGQYTDHPSLLERRIRGFGDELCVCGISKELPTYLSLMYSNDKILFSTKIEHFFERNMYEDCYEYRLQTEILPWEPLGRYTAIVSQGKNYLYYSFYIVSADKPLFYYSPRIEAYIASDFEPFERIHVLEHNDNSILQAAKLSLDNKGEGVLVNSVAEGHRVWIDGILRQYQNDCRYIKVTNGSSTILPGNLMSSKTNAIVSCN